MGKGSMDEMQQDRTRGDGLRQVLDKYREAVEHLDAARQSLVHTGLGLVVTHAPQRVTLFLRMAIDDVQNAQSHLCQAFLELTANYQASESSQRSNGGEGVVYTRSASSVPSLRGAS